MSIKLKDLIKEEKQVVKEAKKPDRKKIAGWIVSNFDNFTGDWDDSELLDELGLSPGEDGDDIDAAFKVVSDIVNKMKKAAK